MARALPALSDVKIIFKKNPPPLTITKPDAIKGKYWVEIEDMKLYVKRLNPYNSVLNDIEAKLNAGTRALYYMQHHVTRSFPVEKNVREKRVESILRVDYLPHTIIFGLIDDKVYFHYTFGIFLVILSVSHHLLKLQEVSGLTSASNFQFGSHFLASVYFQSGADRFPSVPFQPNFNAGGNWSRSFSSLFGASGVPAIAMKSDTGLARVTYQNFKDCFALYRISLTRQVTELNEYMGPTMIDQVEQSVGDMLFSRFFVPFFLKSYFPYIYFLASDKCALRWICI